jgi:hypothetical protein
MMNQRFFLCSIPLSTSVAFAMIAACGGNTATSDAGSDATTNDSSSNDAASDTAQNNDASDGAENNDAADNDGGTCDGGCYACCAEQNEPAAAKLFMAARACGCTNPGDCHTACAMSLCNAVTPKVPDKACVECLLSVDAGNCGETAAASCADAGCTAVAMCMEMCPP